MIFDETKDLLQKTESIILDVRESKKWWVKKVDKIITGNTLDFIFSGGNPALLKRIIFIGLGFFALFTIFLDFTREAILINANFSILLAVMLAPFTLFSKSLDDDVKSEDIAKVKQEIDKKGLSSDGCQAVRENLLIMKTALENKTSISKWLIAAMWAVFLYLFLQYFLPSILAGEPIKIKTLQAVALTPVLILALYSLERCFARTSRRVFMTLLFALNETGRNS